VLLHAPQLAHEFGVDEAVGTDQVIRQRCLAVVHMRHDANITDAVLHSVRMSGKQVLHAALPTRRRACPARKIIKGCLVAQGVAGTQATPLAAVLGDGSQRSTAQRGLGTNLLALQPDQHICADVHRAQLC
jgi:hypothetical protein